MDKKEAIEQLKIIKNNIDKKYINTKNSNAIEIVLNLLEEKDNKIAFLEQLYKKLLDYSDNFKKDKDVNYLDGIYYKKLVEKQQAKIKNKDKIIDLMVEEFKKIFSEGEPCDLDHEMECKKYKECKDCIKQYFERKVENGNRSRRVCKN